MRWYAVYKVWFIHSFFLSGYLYSTSSNPLLLRGAPDYSVDTVSELTHRSASGNSERRTCYVAARVGFESATLWTQGSKLTTEPRCPISSARFSGISQKLIDWLVDVCGQKLDISVTPFKNLLKALFHCSLTVFYTYMYKLKLFWWSSNPWRPYCFFILIYSDS